MPLAPEMRTVFKAAVRIHDRLNNPRPEPIPALPADDWNDLVTLARRLRHAHNRRWTTAAHSLRDDVWDRIQWLNRRLLDWLKQVPHGMPAGQPASLRDIVQDLRALQDEFADAALDLKGGTVSCVTEPIVLHGVELGRFEIVLRWKELGEHDPYAVVALDSDDEITHPHVRDDRLCEGEGKAAIEAALRSGRIFDFFTLVRQVLRTYNADNAYRPLERWSGLECRDCGALVTEDDLSVCSLCDHESCRDCQLVCAHCRINGCFGCCDPCPRCDDMVCDHCVSRCRGCDERCCFDCLSDRLCTTCQPEENQPDEAIPKTTTEGATPSGPVLLDTAKPAVHAAGLGQAAVPA